MLNFFFSFRFIIEFLKCDSSGKDRLFIQSKVLIEQVENFFEFLLDFSNFPNSFLPGRVRVQKLLGVQKSDIKLPDGPLELA